MAQTKFLTVSSGAYTPVVALTDTYSITVGEDASVASYPTTDFLVKKGASADPRRVQAGNTYTFTKNSVGHAAMYRTGEAAGSVETVSGTTTFFQDEA